MSNKIFPSKVLIENNAKVEKKKIINRRDVFDYGNHVINMSLMPYWCLLFIRFILTIIPQTGYIHPDEFFQSIEIVNGDIFGFATNRPWEFTSSFPVRSVTIPYIFIGVPLLFLKHSSNFIYNWFGINVITPYFQLVVPRLTMCLLSLLTDFSLYKVCYKYAQNYRTRLLILSTSYVMLVYATRTFSNTIELFLFSLLIFLVADSMARSDKILLKEEYYKNCYDSAGDLKEKIKYHRLRLALPWHMFSSVFAISTVVVLGVFNRPTFLAYAFPPIFFWLFRGLGSSLVTMSDFHMRTLVLILAAIPSFAVIVTCDSLYFGYVTIEQLFARHFSLVEHFVVTPYNFILYNMNTTNLSHHGLHNRLTHVLVNIPLLFNVLGIAGLTAFVSIAYRIVIRKWSSLPRVQSIIVLMTCSYVIPVVALSVFPHQEARFLIPCLLPLVFLHSQTLRAPKFFLTLWYIINILLTIYFGFLQQAGIYPLMKHLQQEVDAKPTLTSMHVVTSHIYPLPLSLLQLKYGPHSTYTSPSGSRYQKAQDFFTYEMGSHSMKIVVTKLQTIQRVSEHTLLEKKLKYRLYFVLPVSLMDDFEDEALRANVSYSVDKVFYPHVSVEALPSVKWHLVLDPCTSSESLDDTCDVKDRPSFSYYASVPIRILLSLANQIGLALIHFPKPSS